MVGTMCVAMVRGPHEPTEVPSVSLPIEQRQEGGEELGSPRERSIVWFTEEALRHDQMRSPDTQGEATADRALGSSGLRGQRQRVAPSQGHHRSPHFGKTRNRSPNSSQRDDRIDAEHLRDPEALESRFLSPERFFSHFGDV
jgi:hypothetical protein